MPVNRTDSMAISCMNSFISHFYELLSFICFCFSLYFIQKTFYGDREIHNSFNENKKYPYESSLELTQVDYSNVDYYYCVKNSSGIDTNFEYLLENKQASRVYLFVEGKTQNISFFILNKEFTSIYFNFHMNEFV